MKFNFKKNNAWDFIGGFLLYAIITFFYYALGPESESQSKIGKINRGLHSIIDEFGLDLPAWLQILLFWCFVILVVKSIIFWFEKK